MRKTVATVGAAGFLLLGLAVPANAAMCVPSAGQTFIPPTYEQVLLTPGTDGTPAVTHSEATYTRTLPAVGEPTIIVQVPNPAYVPEVVEVGTPTIPNPAYVGPSTKHHDAEYATDYLYVKQVKGIWQQQTGHGRWQDTGEAFDWETWSGNSTRWEGPNFTETGPHNSVQSTEGKKRKVSTTYRYVQTGQTRQGAETKAAWDEPIPGNGEPETIPNEAYVAPQPAVGEPTVDQEQPNPDYLPEHPETTGWVEQTPEGEGWEVFDTRVVTDVEAVLGTDPTYDSEMTDPGQEFIAPVTCEDPAAPVSVTVSGGVVPTVAEQRVDVPDETLAQTGASPLPWALGALALIGGGAWLIRRTRNA